MDDPVNRADAWGLFSFEERPLDGPSGSQISISNVLLKKANLEGKHVQGFYDDGSGDNVGLFPDGLRRDEKHPRSNYEPKSSHYPDDVAREAERILRHEGIGDYETVGNNCQDFEDKMTQKMYDIGRYFRGSVLDPR